MFKIFRYLYLCLCICISLLINAFMTSPFCESFKFSVFSSDFLLCYVDIFSKRRLLCLVTIITQHNLYLIEIKRKIVSSVALIGRNNPL